jgi:hypothetical protein
MPLVLLLGPAVRLRQIPPLLRSLEVAFEHQSLGPISSRMQNANRLAGPNRSRRELIFCCESDPAV